MSKWPSHCGLEKYYMGGKNYCWVELSSCGFGVRNFGGFRWVHSLVLVDEPRFRRVYYYRGLNLNFGLFIFGPGCSPCSKFEIFGGF